MPTEIVINGETPVLVELHQVRGIEDFSRLDDLFEASSEALESAMTSIYGMAQRTVSTINSLPEIDKPNSVEVAFGLKLTSEATAYIVTVGGESQITVKLTWNIS